MLLTGLSFMLLGYSGITGMQSAAASIEDLYSQGMQHTIRAGKILDRFNAPKAEQAGLDFRFGVSHPELKEHYYGEVSNANMANIQVDKLPKTDVTLSISKSDLTQVVLGKTTLDKLVKEGKANLEGDAQLIKALSECLDEFDGLFEILPMPNKKA